MEVEKQLGKQLKIVRLDRGGEYYGRYTEKGQLPGLFTMFLQEHGIVTQYIMQGSYHKMMWLKDETNLKRHGEEYD